MLIRLSKERIIQVNKRVLNYAEQSVILQNNCFFFVSFLLRIGGYEVIILRQNGAFL